MDFDEIETDRFPLYCRTCLKQYQGTKHIVNDLETSILRLLKQCVHYDSNKLYPDGICQECYGKLKSFREFQNTCRKTKQYFDKLTSDNILLVPEFKNGDLVSKTVDNVQENQNPLQDEHEHIVVKVDIDDLVNLAERTEAENDFFENSYPCEITDVSNKADNKASKTHQCKICKKFYSSSTVLKGHMLNHAEQRAFTCDICGDGFNAKCLLVRHMEKHSIIQIACKFNCGQTFDRTYKAEKHYRKTHADELKCEAEKPTESFFVCEMCGKSFKTLRSLNDHRNSHLPEEKRPFRCDQCGKRFAQAADLRIHVMRHEGTKKFECSYCGSKKTTARELRLHISNIHTKDRQVRCGMCSKIFVNPGCLKRHEKAVHFGQKKFKCSYCDEAFATGETLKYHERRHTGEKPHQCTVCGHRFIQPYALKKHMNTHKDPQDCI